MKLTRDCKYLLNEIARIPPDKDNIHHSVTFVALYLSEQDRFDKASYVGALDTLASLKAIEWSNPEHSFFKLTEAGRNYKEIDRLERNERWKERLIGFIVGALAVIIEEAIRCII
ncbi:MAG: hypothetical protein HFG26_09060 [Provencibacterium sp.]|jgi:hypothetical protein|nr:hypothetical protein [Provencibacterium sp.]